MQLTQLNQPFTLIEPNSPSQTHLIILRLKSSPYTFSMICIGNPDKSENQLKLIYFFKPSQPS